MPTKNTRTHSRTIAQLLSWNKALCESLQREYDHASYDDLMNTTFALLPAGRSPATYRLGEALSAGAIPVFVHQVRLLLQLVLFLVPLLHAAVL